MSSGNVPFWSLVDVSGGPDACWPWIGTTDRDGYGIWGRSASGTANGRNVLNEIQVLRIYYAPGSLAAIAAMFGVTKWTVHDIKRGKTWGWLTAPYSQRERLVSGIDGNSRENPNFEGHLSC